MTKVELEVKLEALQKLLGEKVTEQTTTRFKQTKAYTKAV